MGADVELQAMKIFGFTLPNWSEVGWTRAVACVAILLLTIALAALNVSGAWIASGGNVAYTCVIAGVEVLAATVLVLLLAAPTWPRKLVGAATALAIIYVAVSNGQVSVTASFASIYKDEKGQNLSPDALRKKAEVATGEAAALAITAPKQANTDAEEIASLKNEQELMASETRIKEAQLRLKSLGLYSKDIDGIRGVDTQQAMQSRGEAARKRIELLTTKTEAKQAPASDKSIEAIDLSAKADAIDAGKVNLYMLLLACELARTAGLWAFVQWSTARRVAVDPGVFKDLQEQADELARRKANIDAGVEKRETAKEKRDREKREKAEKDAKVAAAILRIADESAALAKRETVKAELDAEAAVDPNAKPDAVAEPEPEPEALAEAEAEAPATPPSANDEDEQSEAA